MLGEQQKTLFFQQMVHRRISLVVRFDRTLPGRPGIGRERVDQQLARAEPPVAFPGVNGIDPRRIVL